MEGEGTFKFNTVELEGKRTSERREGGWEVLQKTLRRGMPEENCLVGISGRKG
jgi:hypothetical protein